jgi:hypothetical protein
MKVDLYIARQTAFRFNIAIAEPTAMKRNWPLPDAMLASGRVAYCPENISAEGLPSRRLSRRCDSGVAPA